MVGGGFELPSTCDMQSVSTIADVSCHRSKGARNLPPKCLTNVFMAQFRASIYQWHILRNNRGNAVTSRCVLGHSFYQYDCGCIVTRAPSVEYPPGPALRALDISAAPVLPGSTGQCPVLYPRDGGMGRSGECALSGL
jgi:hypothetical protein